MSDDVDIRSGGLIAVDTDALRELSGALGLIAAHLDEAADALAAAGAASLAACAAEAAENSMIAAAAAAML